MKNKAILILAGFLIGYGSGGLTFNAVNEMVNPPKEEIYEEYTVKPGDTFWAISNEYRAKDCRNPYTLEYKHELEKLNPGLNYGALQVGQKVKVRYLIRRGEYEN